MNAPYGLVAEFASPEEVLAAARRAWQAGYRTMDAYTPFAVEGLAEAVGFPKTRVPLVTLLCGLAGGAGGYFMMWYSATISYPLNVGGRPLNSWPAFIPITFELAILCAALGTVIGMLALNGLPRPYHPIFNTPHFADRSGSRFYLCVKAADRLYDPEGTREFLRQAGASDIWEVAK